MNGTARPGPTRRYLHDRWTVKLASPSSGEPSVVVGRAIPARVPGAVHTDLLDAGLIPDPLKDTAENDVQWIGRSDWVYACEFDWTGSDAERVELVFEGVDTVADITLNGGSIARVENMHRIYRLEVTDHLIAGSNQLAVHFTAPITEAELRAAASGYPYDLGVVHPYNQLRKMACNFGWDWGPDLATVGLWRPVYLESWSRARLSAVRPLATVVDGVGIVDVDIEVETAGRDGVVQLEVSARIGEVSVSSTTRQSQRAERLRLELPDPALWWPRSLGQQNRHRLVVDLLVNGRVIDTWSSLIGFRSIVNETQADAIGSQWSLVVNDVPMWIRGANWIPDDPFPSRVDTATMRTRIEQACAANVDLLRVWGGGVYESDAFYEICDELGVMVWQDFAFACAAYPETPELWDEVEAEAIDNVTRLVPHPSLILWNGNNENQWLHGRDGWADDLAGRPWGEGYYDDLLPGIVSALDPSRPYWAGSPYSGGEAPPNDPAYGTTHIWDVWNTEDYDHYRAHRPRFAAEFGFQGPPTFATLSESITERPLRPNSPSVVHHQKARDGMAKLRRGLLAHFPEPEAFQDWHFLTQINQARAVSLGVEWFRSLPECSGSVLWQLNDCWSAISWAVIDGAGRPKPAWYALRRSYRDRLVTVQPSKSGLSLVASNLSPTRWKAEATIRKVDVAGREVARLDTSLDVEAFGLTTMDLPAEVAISDRPSRELLIVDVDQERTVWSWVPDKDFDYPPGIVDVAIEQSSLGHTVSVHAQTLLRDVCLFADRIEPDAQVDDMLKTLLPGESARFEVTGVSSSLLTGDLEARHALRFVNDVPEVTSRSQLPHPLNDEGVRP